MRDNPAVCSNNGAITLSTTSPHTLHTTDNLQHHPIIRKEIAKKNTIFLVITKHHYKTSHNSYIPYTLKLTCSHL